MLPVVVSFFPLFFWEPFPNVIFDIPEVSKYRRAPIYSGDMATLGGVCGC